MKVSIIVPVYNVEKYIQRCFDSIMNQTYDNIECIFIDDCSPDNCFEILSTRILEYKGKIDFVIIKHEENKGLSGARNTGTIVANGEYIYYLDSDDEITYESIEILVKLANNYPGVEVVQGNTKTIPQQKFDWRNLKLKNYPEYINDNLWIKKNYFSKPYIPVNAWNKLIRRSFIIENNLFFKEGIIHEDEHWMFYLVKKINKIAFSNEICYNHYIINGSIMQAKNNDRSLESWLVILNELSSKVDPIYITLQRRYIYSHIKNILININNTNNEKIFFQSYHLLIKRNLIRSLKSIKIVESTLLLTYLLPQFIFRNIFIRALSAFLIKFI